MDSLAVGWMDLLMWVGGTSAVSCSATKKVGPHGDYDRQDFAWRLTLRVLAALSGLLGVVTYAKSSHVGHPA
jgi:hypothetical protein